MVKQKVKSVSIRVFSLALGLLCLVLLGLNVNTIADETRLADAENAFATRETSLSRFNSLNLVQNGDFENDFDGWVPVDSAFISTAIVHSGAKALLTSDPDSTRFSYVYQELNFAYDTTEVTFWVYPQSVVYRSHFGLIQGWKTPSAVYSTLLEFRDNGIIFVVPDTSDSFANVLTPKAWNKVVIQVNSTTLTQDLYINDTLVSSLTTVFAFPTVEHLLVGDLSPGADYGTLYYDDISITGADTFTPVCPFVGDPFLAIEDETFDDRTWTSEIIRNSAAPGNAWTLNRALQYEETTVPHYPSVGNPSPGRWVRYSYSGQSGQDAAVEVATWYAKSIVPTSGSLQSIQFDFDFWGRGIRMGPMILQEGTYYRGPSFVTDIENTWKPYSSGCLTADDFEKQAGSGPDRPDFSQPIVVGYSLSNTTNTISALRDHFIDNFRFFVGGTYALGDAPSFPNRPPFAFPDVRVVRVDDGPYDLDITWNDVDVDGDPLTIKSVTDPEFSTTRINPSGGVIYGTPNVEENPFGGPSSDSFEYTITDGEFDATTGVLILFDYCSLESIAFQKGDDASEDFDLALIRRFRDEVMKPTTEGANLVDHYYEKTPSLLKTLIIDRPDLGARAFGVVELLQPSLRDMLDGDGSLLITQTQMDSLKAFFTDLAEAGNTAVKELIAGEMDRLGSFDDYVGQPVSEALDVVLGDPVGTAIEEEPPSIPTDFVLEQNFPNPFEASTEIRYALPGRTSVSLMVYDIQGRKVRTLLEKEQGQGVQSVVWDGLDDSGVAVSSGVYFVRLITPGYRQTKQVVMSK